MNTYIHIYIYIYICIYVYIFIYIYIYRYMDKEKKQVVAPQALVLQRVVSQVAVAEKYIYKYK